MQDRLFIADYFSQYYDELTAKEFYREIFPQGQLAEKGQQITGKYNALAVELLPVESENGERKRNNARKYIITDDLQVIDEIVKSDNFTIISPISYAGKSRKAENARFIYALAIDLDGITAQGHINELMHQINTIEYIPKPTYIVWSGTGLHLYYQFKEAIPCFKNIVKQYNVSRSYMAYNSVNDNVCILVLPVFRVNIPKNHLHSCIFQKFLVHISVRRSYILWRSSCNTCYNLISLINFSRCLIVISPCKVCV